MEKEEDEEKVFKKKEQKKQEQEDKEEEEQQQQQQVTKERKKEERERKTKKERKKEKRKKERKKIIDVVSQRRIDCRSELDIHIHQAETARGHILTNSLLLKDTENNYKPLSQNTLSPQTTTAPTRSLRAEQTDNRTL